MKNKTTNSIQVLYAKFISHNCISRSNLLIFYFLLFFLAAGLDYMSESHIRFIRYSLKESLEPLKVEAHKLIQIPKLVKSFLDIKRENELLRRELNILKLTNLTASAHNKELEEIKRILDIKYNFEQFDILEKVLGFEASIYNSSIIISKTHANIAEDNIVITPDGLIGTISAVYEKSARVLPITNSLTTIPVQTNSGIHLIIRGTDKNELVAVEIQQEELLSELTVGDILYTSGEGGFYKKGIPVAKITSVNRSKSEVHATPIVQLSNINYVWITSSNRS